MESLEGVDTFVLNLQIESESGVQEVKSPRINEENPGMLRRIFFPLFSRDYFIQFHGQRYTLQLKRPLRPKEVDYAVTVLALCAGLIIILLLGLTGIVASRRALEARQRNELIHKEVAEKTAELSVKNMQLRREVEERLEVEQALAASEYRFRELFDRMSNGVAVYQADGPEGKDFVGIDFNRAAREIDRKGKDELVGRTVREIFPVFGENVLLPVIRRVWATGVAEEIPETIFNCNGMNCWRKYNVYRLPVGEVVVLCSDITEQVRIEEELRQAHMPPANIRAPRIVSMFVPSGRRNSHAFQEKNIHSHHGLFFLRFPGTCRSGRSGTLQ
ncbi:MAG: hypothetical protein BM485_05840 [Desulfobulbaceae bacterium DB1]|nr:MAG: hypothetical protein BM485_05840 [Desulfobulbaceae bacterium DB1]